MDISDILESVFARRREGEDFLRNIDAVKQFDLGERTWSRFKITITNTCAGFADDKDAPELLRNMTVLGSNIDNPTESPMINTVQGVAWLTDLLICKANLEHQPAIFLDIEGVNLGRHGLISIMQIYLHPLNVMVMVDVTSLGRAAFETKGELGFSLQDILQSTNYAKYLFDLRNDSNALYFLYGVRLRNVRDVQLAWVYGGTRNYNLRGLAQCLRLNAGLSTKDATYCESVKKAGKDTFLGDYTVFERRPLSPALLRYCATDVAFLPMLWKKCHDEVIKDGPGIPNPDGSFSRPYFHRGREHSLNLTVATDLRLITSMRESYDPNGRGKGYSPYEMDMWDKEDGLPWMTLPKENTQAEIDKVIRRTLWGADGGYKFWKGRAGKDAVFTRLKLEHDPTYKLDQELGDQMVRDELYARMESDKRLAAEREAWHEEGRQAYFEEHGHYETEDESSEEEVCEEEELAPVRYLDDEPANDDHHDDGWRFDQETNTSIDDWAADTGACWAAEVELPGEWA